MARPSGAVRTARQFGALSGRQRAAYERTVEARRYMRAGDSLTVAARRAGTSPRTVMRYAGSDLGKRGRRWRVTRDRAYRPMRVLTNTGIEVVDASRRDASTVGRYWSAVGHYIQHGDDSELRKLRGVTVNGYELETDLDVIDELAARGELDFEDIYELAA
jgi:hypothetical protein